MGSDILLLPIALEQSHNKIQDIYGKIFTKSNSSTLLFLVEQLYIIGKGDTI